MSLSRDPPHLQEEPQLMEREMESFVQYEESFRKRTIEGSLKLLSSFKNLRVLKSSSLSCSDHRCTRFDPFFKMVDGKTFQKYPHHKTFHKYHPLVRGSDSIWSHLSYFLCAQLYTHIFFKINHRASKFIKRNDKTGVFT